MTGTDLREKSDAELRELSDESREAMFRLKMELRTGQLDQPGKVRALRRDIARIETILRERALAASA